MSSESQGGARPFGGFPAGRLGTVIIPTPFFTELLPQIDHLAELKLTLYCFWALQQREGEYRYVRLRDLLGDTLLLQSLTEGAPEPASAEACEAVLRDALRRATLRATLLAVSVPAAAGQGEETLYFMNTDKGRRAVAALERGDWLPDLASLDRPVVLIADRPSIFALYEQNIGPLTPLLAETLRDAEVTYPAEWIAEAFQIAVENNKRNWRYMEAILRRWATEGKTEPRHGQPEGRPNAGGRPERRARPGSTDDAERYVQDAYFQRRRGARPQDDSPEGEP